MTNNPISPDGKFMWTGSEWIPVPPNTSSQKTSMLLQDSVIGGDVNITQNNPQDLGIAMGWMLKQLGGISKIDTNSEPTPEQRKEVEGILQKSDQIKTLGAPVQVENPNPVKNTETGDYMLTFLDPATKHKQFTLELSLTKADDSPAIGPLTQKNGIFNLGKLENGEYKWALSRVNTVKNKKTSTRNGKFTISDSLPPAINPPAGAFEHHERIR